MFSEIITISNRNGNSLCNGGDEYLANCLTLSIATRIFIVSITYTNEVRNCDFDRSATFFIILNNNRSLRIRKGKLLRSRQFSTDIISFRSFTTSFVDSCNHDPIYKQKYMEISL